MKKIIACLIIISLLPSLCFATDIQGMPENMTENLVKIGVVVNDVLYAGFSMTRVVSFQPPTTDITQDVRFEDKGDYFKTPGFFAYCLASTPNTISYRYGFDESYKKPNDTSNVGYLVSVSDPSSKVEVTLNGAGADLSKWIPVNTGTATASDPPEGTGEGGGASASSGEASTTPRFACSEELSLSIPKSVLASSLLTGDYVTVLRLELKIE